jgi:hypothetical protein
MLIKDIILKFNSLMIIKINLSNVNVKKICAKKIIVIVKITLLNAAPLANVSIVIITNNIKIKTETS